MQENYIENCGESEKYPYAIFTGKINEQLDFTQNATHTFDILENLDIDRISIPRIIYENFGIKGRVIIFDVNLDVKV